MQVDKPGADIERVKQELLGLNLVAEEWGGTTPIVPVSAKKGTGVSDLLQMVGVGHGAVCFFPLRQTAGRDL